MSVQADDVLSQAMSAAMARIAEMEPHMGATLIDEMSIEEWLALDGTACKVLVTDPNGLDGTDALDLDEAHPQAA